MKIRELLAALAAVAGALLIVGGNWLIWDWINSIVHYLNWDAFMQHWSFPAPLFIYTWDPMHWTGPYDTGLAMQILGIILLVAGIYILGKYKD